MKRKCVSSILSAIMLFSCIAPSFAADVEPYNNRYRYEYVYSSPDYVEVSTSQFTLEDYEEQLYTEAVHATVLVLIAAAIPGGIEDLAMAKYAADVAAALASLHAACGWLNKNRTYYTVTISQRSRYKYRVDCLDESRRFLEQTRVYTKVETTYYDDTSTTVFHEYDLK